VGQQQWVEILKALYIGVQILILDEPTSVLTPQEAEKLFCLLLRMRSEGIAVVLITHKLSEVMSISDRVTVLRKGRAIATRPTAEVTKEELARLMVGRDLEFTMEAAASKPAGDVLQLVDLHVANHRRRETLHAVSLSVRQGEILGLAGVSGNGQSALFDAVVGVANAARGRVLLESQDLTGLSPSERAEMGLASIPPDRLKQGLLLDFSVAENLILGLQRSAPFRSRAVLNLKEVAAFAQKAIREYEIQTSGANQRAGVLSGGNLQKLILARELSRPIKVLVASSPTRGLDVGATLFVHRRLAELRDQGVAILLISEDLDEVFSLSTRIAVMFKGKIMGIAQRDEVSRERIGLFMAGVAEGAV
jgi:simple sugar transport system ATP-binding protein